MAVRIQFDKPNARHFTNLDFVTGRVILTLPTDATISAVTVKLEGESRTRLAGPKTPQDERKRRTEVEVHKLLYKVQTVFPTPQMQEGSAGASSQYTLLAGQYTYPFSFKLPFNNSCKENTSLLRDLKLGSLNVPIAPDTNQHVKSALPPTLSGFPGEAEIKYYVKATLIRPKFYQENIRYQVDIKFFPIEPPRPPPSQEEVFARRKHQFQKIHAQPTKKGLFRKSSVPEPDEEPTIFQVDARLPNPPIITCNEPLPLRILVHRLDSASTSIYLSMLQVELIATTHVRARDLKRAEVTSWIIISQANMDMPLGDFTNKEAKEWKIPSYLWDNLPLPNTVAPTFETCNLSRKYELEVRVGLTHGMATGLRPELIVLPLRLPVKVFSGIAPPASLLNALANQSLLPSQTLHDTQTCYDSVQGKYPAPSSPSSPTAPDQNFPARFGSSSQVIDPEEPPPPSYEDAMAEDIGPLDGPRRDYNPPIDPPNSPGGSSSSFAGDTKSSGGLRRHVSERLFPQNAPRRPNEPDPMRESNLHNSLTLSEDGEGSRGTTDEIETPPPKPPRRQDTKKSIREV